MHDPLVVAFEIRRPWPQRSSLPATGSRGDGVRWRIRLHHDCGSWCVGDPPHKSGPFPWWKPRSYMSHWRLAGRDFYWPALVTVWHREPGNRDSGEVCPHTRRVWDEANRRWRWRQVRRWRWHVHHWRIQIPPLQGLRRWALTRCAWCGGKSRKGDVVNTSHSWDGERAHWWQGECGLFHRDCSAVEHAQGLCICPEPMVRNGRNYGKCLLCGKFRPYGHEPDEADLLLSSLPEGSRITPDIRPRIESLWADRRARKERAETDG